MRVLGPVIRAASFMGEFVWVDRGDDRCVFRVVVKDVILHLRVVREHQVAVRAHVVRIGVGMSQCSRSAHGRGAVTNGP